MVAQKILKVLKGAKSGDRESALVDFFLMFLIITNVAAVILESVQSIGKLYADEFLIFEIFSVTIFSIEYILRFWTAGYDEDLGKCSAIKRRCKYAFSFNGIVDLIAILPSLLPLIFPNVDLRTLRILRLARILKISNYSTALEDLYESIYAERRALSASLYIFLLVVMFSSSATYMAENEAQPDTFSSIPQTIWWSVITLTTVGYGDVYPVTTLGQFFGALTAFMGVCTVALLTGIIAASFSNQAAKRKARHNLVIYRQQVVSAYKDGTITDDEEKMLQQLQKQLDISKHDVLIIHNEIYN